MNKKLYMLAVILFSSISLYAQIPNPGMEMWVLQPGPCYDPQDYTSSNQIAVGYYPVAKDSVIKHSGTFSARLTNIQIFPGVVDPGLIGTGTLNTTTYAISGGFPDTVKHANFQGYFIYHPGTTDSSLFIAMLTHWNGTSRDTIAIARMAKHSYDTVFTLYTVPFVYYNDTVTPDTGFVLLSASSILPLGAKPNSQLWVDDLAFSGIYSSIKEVEPVLPIVKVLTDPANGQIYFHVENSMVHAIRVFDIHGKLLYTVDVKRGNNLFIEASTLATGEYMIQFLNSKQIALGSGKFVIAR